LRASPAGIALSIFRALRLPEQLSQRGIQSQRVAVSLADHTAQKPVAYDCVEHPCRIDTWCAKPFALFCVPEIALFFADVFIPHGWIRANIVGEHQNTFFRVEIDYRDSEGAEPVDAALEVPALANNNSAESKLAHEATAVPTGGKRSHHDQLAVAFLPACISKGVRLTVYGRITLLHAAVATRANQLSSLIKNGGTDRNAAFVEAKTSLFESNREHGLVVEWSIHGFLSGRGAEGSETLTFLYHLACTRASGRVHFTLG
jgi:hypothetical protein